MVSLQGDFKASLPGSQLPHIIKWRSYRSIKQTIFRYGSEKSTIWQTESQPLAITFSKEMACNPKKNKLSYAIKSVTTRLAIHIHSLVPVTRSKKSKKVTSSANHTCDHHSLAIHARVQ